MTSTPKPKMGGRSCTLDKLEMMRTMVELGANLNAKGLNNGRPLHIAAGFRGGGEAVGGDGR
jgi:hypothetical protein